MVLGWSFVVFERVLLFGLLFFLAFIQLGTFLVMIMKLELVFTVVPRV